MAAASAPVDEAEGTVVIVVAAAAVTISSFNLFVQGAATADGGARISAPVLRAPHPPAFPLPAREPLRALGTDQQRAIAATAGQRRRQTSYFCRVWCGGATGRKRDSSRRASPRRGTARINPPPSPPRLRARPSAPWRPREGWRLALKLSSLTRGRRALLPGRVRRAVPGSRSPG